MIIGVLAAIVLYVLLPSFQLVKTADRQYAGYPISEELRKRITEETKGFSNEKEIIEYSKLLTAELLEFSEQNNIGNGKANCIGYSKLCNYGLITNKFKGRVKPVVGYVTWCGINLCNVVKMIVPKDYRNFVKDHDFVEWNAETHNAYFSPTIYDIVWKDCYTIENN